MEKRPLENTEHKQKGYKLAVTGMQKIFIKFFIAAVITVSLLGCGKYLYQIVSKTAGIICTSFSAVGLIATIYFSYKILQYFLKYKE